MCCIVEKAYEWLLNHIYVCWIIFMLICCVIGYSLLTGNLVSDLTFRQYKTSQVEIQQSFTEYRNDRDNKPEDKYYSKRLLFHYKVSKKQWEDMYLYFQQFREDTSNKDIWSDTVTELLLSGKLHSVYFRIPDDKSEDIIGTILTFDKKNFAVEYSTFSYDNSVKEINSVISEETAKLEIYKELQKTIENKSAFDGIIQATEEKIADYEDRLITEKDINNHTYIHVIADIVGGL